MPNANMIREERGIEKREPIPRTGFIRAYEKFNNEGNIRELKRKGMFPNTRIPTEASSTLRFAAAVLIEAADCSDANRMTECLEHQQTAKGLLSQVIGVFGEGARYLEP